MNITEIRKEIMNLIPPATRFSAADAAVIARHRDLLASWGPEIVKSFYDVLYQHAPTAAVFKDGERPAREDTLANFWRRVLEGPIDDKFFDWMTFVGLVHVLRKVKNPMMLAAWSHIMREINTRAATQLDPAARAELDESFTRLGATITSLVADTYLKGIAEATGTSLALLETLASQQAEDLVAQARKTM
jgi:hypothetical protein